MKKSGGVTSKGERASYGMYYFAQNIYYTFVTTYTATYLLNNGVSETAVAAILLVPKIWDAVNDPIFGVIIDKVKFKNGRFLPWVKLSVFIIPVTTLLLFSMPAELPESIKTVWIIVAYILWDLAYTVCDAPIFALATTMTGDLNERTTIFSMARITGTLGSFVPLVAVPQMYGENGLDLGWGITAAIVCAFAFSLMLPICFTVKERANVKFEKERSVKTLVKAFSGNKYLLVFFLIVFLINSTNGIQVLNPIFCQYVLGNETLATGLLVAATVPVFGIALVMPKLARKIDKFYMYSFSVLVFIIASLVQFLAGYEVLSLLYVTMFIKGIGYGGMVVLAPLFTPDCIEYGHYKSGTRNEGMCFSLQTFVSKLSGAAVTSIIMFAISSWGFDSSAVTVQGKDAVWFAFTVFSSIGSVIALPLLFNLYKLRDKDVKLMALCNSGAISRSECEARLSEKKRYY